MTVSRFGTAAVDDAFLKLVLRLSSSSAGRQQLKKVALDCIDNMLETQDDEMNDQSVWVLALMIEDTIGVENATSLLNADPEVPSDMMKLEELLRNVQQQRDKLSTFTTGDTDPLNNALFALDEAVEELERYVKVQQES